MTRLEVREGKSALLRSVKYDSQATGGAVPDTLHAAKEPLWACNQNIATGLAFLPALIEAQDTPAKQHNTIG